MRCVFQESHSGRKQTGIIIVQRECWRKKVNLILPGIMKAPSWGCSGAEKEARSQRDLGDGACQASVAPG
jgi:hypothetical protein